MFRCAAKATVVIDTLSGMMQLQCVVITLVAPTSGLTVKQKQ